MVDKFRFKRLFCYEEPTIEVTSTLNHICTLFHGYEASGLPVQELATEFFNAVRDLLSGIDIMRLDLKYLEVE